MVKYWHSSGTVKRARGRSDLLTASTPVLVLVFVLVLPRSAPAIDSPANTTIGLRIILAGIPGNAGGG